jgi:hypothetical protein
MAQPRVHLPRPDKLVMRLTHIPGWIAKRRNMAPQAAMLWALAYADA